MLMTSPGFPSSSDSKESACNARDPGSIPGSRRSPGKGNGNPLQYSCLENSVNRGAWRATVHGVARVRHDLSTKEVGWGQGGERAMVSVYVLMECVGGEG